VTPASSASPDSAENDSTAAATAGTADTATTTAHPARTSARDATPAAMSAWAFMNLSLVLTLLYILRIVIAGLIVFGALLTTGVIMISQQTTLSLLDVESLSNTGWSFEVVVAGREFFISETLFKVALLLASLAALYFVVITMNTSQELAYGADEAVFLREVLALWSCYKAMLESSKVQVHDFPVGAAELHEAVHYAPSDTRLIYEFFRCAQVYALATCGPEDFAAAPKRDSLVFEQERSNGPVLVVSTRRRWLKDKARRRKHDLGVDVHIVIVRGGWLLATLQSDATIEIDDGRFSLGTPELKISSWRTGGL
jgi:hypothetical protein